MTKSVLAEPAVTVAAASAPRRSWIDPLALWSVVRITAARQGRGKRTFIIAGLLALPIALGMIIRNVADPYLPKNIENLLLFVLIFQGLMPLVALLFATGMVQDDIEEQTLTYLLIRPIPRGAIYCGKLVATLFSAWTRVAFFTALAFAVVYFGNKEMGAAALVARGAVILGLEALALAAYVSIFGFMGLWAKRALLIGAIYIVLLENALAYIDFAFRNLTVMFHIRVLSVSWLDIPADYYNIDPATAPSVSTSLIALASITAVITGLGAWIFSVREYRMKTPEGV